MKKLRRNFERFCFQHRNKGIPNLMLYLTLGAALVYLMSYFSNNYVLYYYLAFDKALILKGQIWRLISYPLVYGIGNPNIVLVAVSMYCYYSLGRAMESIWGTLRFNLYILTGILLMDVFCMVFGGSADVYYLYLSLFLGYATLFPEARFLLFFIIPVKAWIFAVVDLGLTFFDVFRFAYYGRFPYCLFPLVALLNYFLFFGKDVLNVFPFLKRRRVRKPKQPTHYKTVPFPQKADFIHRCTICGRTDATNPELEFRYCSRCNGYYCYCEEHISNHTHIQ